MESEHIGIVGGGLLGLSLADRFRSLGHRVTVLEAAPEVGGLASAWTLSPNTETDTPPPPLWGRSLEPQVPAGGGLIPTAAPPPGSGLALTDLPRKGGGESVRWDKFYHVILLSDSYTHALLRRLNLQDEFVGTETKTGFYTDGRLYSMSNSLEFLRFPPLGLWSKFWLGMTILRASRTNDWQQLEQIPVVDWLTKLSGRRTVEKIWLPLLKAKLGDSYREASAAFIWATIQRMYAARKSGMKKELFGYVKGGYGRIVDRFLEVLTAEGVEIRTSAAVRRIDSPAGVGPRVELASGDVLNFDRVVCTAAPPLAVKLLPDLAPNEREQLKGVKYQGIVCASVLLKNPLDRFYVTNLTDPWVPFTGVIEMSALVDRSEFGGKSLVYLPKYVAPDDPVISESDESIRERFTAALERMYPHFSRADVLAFQIARVKHVFPIPTLGYSTRVPSMRTSLPGVFLVNSSQIVNGTLNVNETLQLAERGFAAVTRTENAEAAV